jgi:hypothetical protein
MNRDGSGPVREFAVDVNQFEVTPVALFIAFVLATPLPWKRRAWQISCGTIVLQIAILAILGFRVWRESMELLSLPSSTGLNVARAMQKSLFDYMGLGLPVLLWLIFNLRAGSLQRWILSRGAVDEEVGAGEACGYGASARN